MLVYLGPCAAPVPRDMVELIELVEERFELTANRKVRKGLRQGHSFAVAEKLIRALPI